MSLFHTSRQYRKLSIAFLIVAVLSAACSSQSDVPGVRLDLPASSQDPSIGRLEWRSDGRMYLAFAPALGATRTIWTRPATGGVWEPLPHINQVCNSPGLQRFVGDPHIIGLSCITGVVNSRVQFGAFTYDLNRKTLQPLFADFQPPQGGYIWNSTTQQGIVGTSGSYGTYYWLTPYGTEPLTLTLQNNTTRWTMSDSVRALREYETSHAAFERYSKAHPVGEAGDMDWAWATAQLAFYASLAPIGRSYSPLARIPWDLYVVDIRSQVIQRIHTTRGDAGSLRWSSDGQWLAYTTPGDGWGQPGGVYLWSLQTRQTYRVHTGSYGSIAWSPDNTHIAAIQEGKELWIYDVRQIVTTAEAPSTRVHRVCCSVYSVGAPAQPALAADRPRRARSVLF